MSLARHRTDIEQELITELGISFPGLIVVGENSNLAKQTPENAWIRTSFTLLDIRYPCIGGVRKEIDGICNVQVFVPLASGAGEASTKIDTVVDILKNSQLTGIEFLTFDVATGSFDSSWYILLLRANYRAQD